EMDVRVGHWAGETEALALREQQRPPAPAAHSGEELREELHTLRAQLEALQGRVADQERAAAQARESLARQLNDAKKLITQIERARYRGLVSRVRRAIDQRVPRGATVAVISRGDPDLVALDRRRGWHFPQTDGGVYAGHHPANSNA